MTLRIRILIVAFVCATVVGGMSYGLWFSGPNQEQAASDETDPLFGWKYPVDKFPPIGLGNRVSFSRSDAYSDFRSPGGVPLGLPVRLKIPVIGVDSAIEDAVLTPDGKMDMPKGSVNVAWFSLGPPPGAVGSAVIGGHFGVREGRPFVFYHLDKLEIGDNIYIEDDKGYTVAFEVRSIRLFQRDADATTVFTSQDGMAHLNLVTCEGIWNKVNGGYPDRRVVFAEAIAMEDTMAVQQAVPTPSPVPTQAPTPTPTPIPAPRVVVESAKGLFATPLDWFMTVLLLGAVGYLAFKIIRRFGGAKTPLS